MVEIIAILYVIIIAVSLAEGIPLAKKDLWKELVIFGLLMLLSVALITAKGFGLQTPAEILYNLLSPTGRIFFSYE